jgi:hypothetical protein
MTEPILEQIALALVDVLEDITEHGGYSVTVSEVVRPTRLEDYTPQHLAIALTQPDPDEDEDQEGAGSLKMWIQPFQVHCFIQVSDKDETPIDTLANRFRADVEKAVRQDPTLGGLATDLRVRSPESWIFKSNRSFEGVTVNI